MDLNFSLFVLKNTNPFLIKKFTKYSTIIIVIYYFLKRLLKTHKTVLYYLQNELNNKIIEKFTSNLEFYPTFYLPNLITQLIFNELKPVPKISYRREYLKTEDGGIISLDWVLKCWSNKVNKIIVILHGMTGGSETSYIRDIVKGYEETEEFKIVVVQFRGINDTPLITPKSYHCGNCADIKLALKHIQRLYPEYLCFCLGTSMGANLFVKLFASTNEFDDYVKGFVSISNPFNLLELERRLRGGVFDYFLMNRQKIFLKNHLHVLKYNSGKQYFK
jgi:predicted alpha/beta-fold hydrolase